MTKEAGFIKLNLSLFVRESWNEEETSVLVGVEEQDKANMAWSYCISIVLTNDFVSTFKY